MRVFVTGASGFIGSALVSDLLESGHQVVGLARSNASAAALTAAGVEVWHGTIEDLDSLHAAAADADGVVQLAFNNDLSQMEAAAAAELRAVETLGEALAGSGRPLVIASGGPRGSERDASFDTPSPRIASARAALAYARRGVRVSIVRIPPTVHDRTRCDMVTTLARIARAKGVSGYLGDGSNRWPSAHRLDVARLFRLAVEKAPAGSVLHAVGEQGIPLRTMAELIGRRLDLPVAAVADEDAVTHFGFLGRLLGVDMAADNTATRELLGWDPTHSGLLDDLDNGEALNNI